MIIREKFLDESRKTLKFLKSKSPKEVSKTLNSNLKNMFSPKQHDNIRMSEIYIISDLALILLLEALHQLTRSTCFQRQYVLANEIEATRWSMTWGSRRKVLPYLL